MGDGTEYMANWGAQDPVQIVSSGVALIDSAIMKPIDGAKSIWSNWGWNDK